VTFHRTEPLDPNKIPEWSASRLFVVFGGAGQAAIAGGCCSALGAAKREFEKVQDAASRRVINRIMAT
jgi:hypothetical protein